MHELLTKITDYKRFHTKALQQTGFLLLGGQFHHMCCVFKHSLRRYIIGMHAQQQIFLPGDAGSFGDDGPVAQMHTVKKAQANNCWA